MSFVFDSIYSKIDTLAGRCEFQMVYTENYPTVMAPPVRAIKQ